MKPVIVAALLAAVGIAAAQTVQPTHVRDVRILGVVPAERWVYVELVTGATYPDKTFIVPHDRHFVVTSSYRPNAAIKANGDDVSPALFSTDVARHDSNTRVVFQPGTVLTAANTSPGFAQAYLWGYLEPL